MIAADDDERRARVGFCRLAEPDDPDLGTLLARDGAAATLADLRAGRLRGPSALRERLTARLPGLDVDRDLAALGSCGGRIVCPGDAEWPPALDELGVRAPYALWLRGAGRLDELAERAVAIVGARASTAYGTYVARWLSDGLADRGWTIVSGGAAGIDAAAHEGALAAGGATVVILACGVDRTYPAAHHSLFADARKSGLVVSELPPGAAPYKHRFLTRNRLIAALGAGTVVVEAALRSGARKTASEARGLGRPLMAVPGPVDSTMSAGCHALLRDDVPAVLVTCADDVLEMVGRIGDDLAPPRRGPLRARDRLSPELAKVLDCVPVRHGVGPAQIATVAGLPLAAVEAGLGLLALDGFVEAHDSGWRLAGGAKQPQGAGA